jgi:uncharacterized membrane protein YhaH (DUF805 family)
MSDYIRDEIYKTQDQKETSELLEIWKTNNRLEWSDVTFDLIQEILKGRGVDIPPQNEPILSNPKPAPPDITYMGFVGFYFSTTGRVRLGTYWLLGVLPYFVLTVAARVLAGLILNDWFLEGSTLFLIALLLVQVFLFWCFIAMTIKRCHDRDKSGWFIFINLIPFIGGIWFFIETCCIPGTKGTNQYGTKGF